MEIYVPTTEELAKFHKRFEEKESGHTEYWLAVSGVVKGLEAGDLKEVAESLAKFLKSWNWEFYRRRPERLPTLVDDLQRLIAEYLGTIMTFRARSIATLAVATCEKSSFS